MYDTTGRLASVDGSTSYVYNAQGQRFAKTGSSGGTLYVYDEAGRIIGEYDSATGAPIQETVWMGDTPVAVLKGSSTYYVHADHLNTPRQIDNASGDPVWVWDTITFGGSSPDEDPLSTGTPFVYNLRFPGQYYDVETGLFQNWWRDYHPGGGRYIQSDPIGLLGGINTYAYVSGNPLKFADPMGLLENFTLTLNRQEMSSLNCECGDSYPAFSGMGDARNDPSKAADKDAGPIPPGSYFIVDRISGGRRGVLDGLTGKDEWFSLYRDDGLTNDKTAVGIVLRGQFRLHPGSISKGCVTLPNKDDYERLRSKLLQTDIRLIPGTAIPYYGTITVK